MLRKLTCALRMNIAGDDYSLIWDPRLIHKFDANPMNYDAPEPAKVDKVTDQDLKINFVNYLKVC